MNNLYTIKNFRVFDEKGATLSIKPITILTGCNSSGKSSIVKSIVLLDTYIKGLKERFKALQKEVLWILIASQRMKPTYLSIRCSNHFKASIMICIG